MRTLGLKGMAVAFDEAVTTGLQRKRTTNEILTDLLRAAAAYRHAASIRYRMTAAKLPAVKELEGFVFEGMPINEGLDRSLHTGSFPTGKGDNVLIAGTGTGKTHLAITIAASFVRAGARGHYFNAVDLVTRIEEEVRTGKAGGLAVQLSRFDLVVLDELGYLPFARSAGNCCSTCSASLREDIGHHHDRPGVRLVAERLRRPQDDHRIARPHHSSL